MLQKVDSPDLKPKPDVPVKKPDVPVKKKESPGGWGEATDPEGDCQMKQTKDKVIITVPGSAHDLSGTKKNAPRMLQESADFLVRERPGEPRRRSEDRPDSCLPIRRFVDDADMRGDDAPTFRESHPGLHLPSDFAGELLAVKQRRGHRGPARARIP